MSDAPLATVVMARTVVWACASEGSTSAASSSAASASAATITQRTRSIAAPPRRLILIVVNSEDFDEWLRTARRILAGRPQTIGLLSVGTPPLDSAAVSKRLAHAMSRLVGQAVGLIL